MGIINNIDYYPVNEPEEQMTFICRRSGSGDDAVIAMLPGDGREFYVEEFLRVLNYDPDEKSAGPLDNVAISYHVEKAVEYAKKSGSNLIRRKLGRSQAFWAWREQHAPKPIDSVDGDDE